MRAKLIAVICLLAPLIAANPAQEAPSPPAPEYTGRNVPMPYSKRGTILNELHDPFPCRDVSLIYARTCHAPGNVGSTDKWFDALARRIGYQNLAVNGVEFPAGLGSCLEGDPIIAIHSFRRLMKLTRERCNATGVVLAGDELGADYLLEYAKTLTREDWSHVRALMFKNPGETEMEDRWWFEQSEKVYLVPDKVKMQDPEPLNWLALRLGYLGKQGRK